MDEDNWREVQGMILWLFGFLFAAGFLVGLAVIVLG